MPRMIFVLVSSLAVMGFVSMAAASPFTTHISAQVSPRDLVVQADFKCRKVDGKLVCGSTKDNKKRDEDDDQDDKPKKSKDKVIPKTCGKNVNCDVGFVKLPKPNKYGACCEAREGLPPAKQQEAEKCKFPGEVGTPPNCSCPAGTEFAGYKGCVVKRQICCKAVHAPTGGGATYCGDSEADARASAAATKVNGEPPTSVTCAPK